MSKQEPGKIVDFFYGKEDHGILTCLITIDMVGSRQGMGGLVLDETTGPAFVAAVCEAFDIKDPELLIGQECTVLRCFDRHNSRIEGLEAPSGKRFIMNEWRQKHHPETKSVLEDERDRLNSQLDSLKKAVRRVTIDLETLDSEYTAWTSKKSLIY